MKIKIGETLYRHPLYSVWSGMKSRCNSKKSRGEYWAGRGITVCAEWITFLPFYEWSIKAGWKKGLTLDRKNNDGNYEPDNCRFTTYSIQNKNRRKPIRMKR